MPTPLLTTGQARGLADWIAAHDRNLTAVYITQGHGDHRFGQCVSGAGNGSACRPARGRPAVPQAAVVPIVTRRHSPGLLKFATQSPEKIANATENTVLHASNGPHRKDCSSNRTAVRAQAELAVRN